ncbi:MAG TPA: hypothetical protein VNP92_18965 [Actinophytocola sp.]|nr:hypothetical protein [Actinophytocola sp.]
MTGWQGNDPDPYQPDPYQQNPYGPTGQYGQDPYQQQPYGGYGQTTPYQQQPYGGYGQEPYQTGGFPAQDWGPPPPPKRSKLPMILGVLAIVIIVGAVVAIVLVNRSGDEPTAAPPEETSKPAPSSEPEQTSDEPPPPSSGEPGDREGWQTVDNTSDSGLTYEVPGDWALSPDPRPSGLDVEFTGTAEFGIYDCEGQTYIRSFATSGDVQSAEGADLDLAKTVSDFAKSFGTSYFKDTAKVDVPAPEELEVDGRPAVKITAPVTPQVSVPACEAAKGEVAIVGVLLEEDGKPAGVAMLAVVSDVEGGPSDPTPAAADVAQDILATVGVG